MKIYFLGGLGSNAFHAEDFIQALDLPVTVIDLPGHGRHFHDVVASPDQLVTWFAEQVDTTQPMILIGHSLGAALAVHLAKTFETVQKLVLLDGGYMNLDQIVSLEEELAGTQAYLAQTTYDDLETAVTDEKGQATYWSPALEKAARESLILRDGKYRLNLNNEAMLALVRLHRSLQGQLKDIKCPALLLPQTKDIPKWKAEMLAAVPPHINVCTIAVCGHSLHTERPSAVARAVREFIQA